MDDDMKIAPENLSELFLEKNPVADEQLALFLGQRANHNTKRAKQLGREFAVSLSNCVWTQTPEDVDPVLFSIQMKLLFAYTVHRLIGDYSPNQIVANTALSSFYEALEEIEPTVFEQINESAAFTLYFYLHRTREESSTSIGKTFASLCSAGESSDCELIGESAYSRFIGICAQQLVSAGYAES